MNKDEYRAEAEQLFEDVESYYRQKLPTSCKDFVSTLRRHANFFTGIENYSAAVEKLTEALDFLEKDSEPFVYERLRIMEDIAYVFGEAENYSEKLSWLERNLKFCREHFTEDAAESLYALRQIILLYCYELADYDKAEQYSRELVDITKRNCGDSHVDTIEAKQKLADILHGAEKYDEARKLREQIVELYRENFSANPRNKVFNYSCFFDASIKLARLIFATADKLDDATNERLKALDRLNSLLEETIEDYSEETDYALEKISGVRDDISGDAQASAKLDELFADYFKNDDEDDDDFSDDEEISFSLGERRGFGN